MDIFYICLYIYIFFYMKNFLLGIHVKFNEEPMKRGRKLFQQSNFWKNAYLACWLSRQWKITPPLLNIFDVINDVHPSKDEDNISRRSDLSRSCCVLYRSTTSFAISHKFPFLSCVKSKLTNNPLERYIEIRLSNFFPQYIYYLFGWR